MHFYSKLQFYSQNGHLRSSLVLVGQILIFSETLKNLKKDLNSSFAFLTRGEIYSLLIQEKNKVLKLKSLKDEIVDSVGAGDIFHRFASVLSTSIKDNNHLILLLAQIAGSIAVTIEGNERTPTLNEIKNTLNFYLNK